MMTKAQLDEDLLVERFTHLPQSPPGLCDVGPSTELMHQHRQAVAEAAHVITIYRRRAIAEPVPDRRPLRASS